MQKKSELHKIKRRGEKKRGASELMMMMKKKYLKKGAERIFFCAINPFSRSHKIALVS